jgi:hypothetical protein
MLRKYRLHCETAWKAVHEIAEKWSSKARSTGQRSAAAERDRARQQVHALPARAETLPQNKGVGPNSSSNQPVGRTTMAEMRIAHK